MSIFRVMAGYTYGHADIVRRAMSKKKASVLEAERADFVAGAERNGRRETGEVYFLSKSCRNPVMALFRKVITYYNFINIVTFAKAY